MATKLGEAYVAIKGDLTDIEEKLRQVGLEFQGFQDDIVSQFGKIASAGSVTAQIGAGLTAGITLPLVGLATAATDAFTEFDSLQRGMVAVTGSASAAKAEIEKLKEVAALPGLGFKEAIEGSVRLQAAGLSADTARNALKAFGNAIATVGGGKAELDGVSLALGQIAAKGKVYAEEINQLNERVPQIRSAIQAAFGTSDAQALQKLGVDAETFVNKVSDSLNKLPPVTGGIRNAFENLQDQGFRVLASAGEALAPVIEKVAGILSDQVLPAVQGAINWFKQLPGPVQTGIAALVGLAAAAGPVLVVVGSVAAGLASLAAAAAPLGGIGAAIGIAFNAVVGTGAVFFAEVIVPVGLAVAALIALGTWVYDNWKPIVAVLKQAWDGLSDLWHAALDPVFAYVKTIWDGVKTAWDTVVTALKDNINLLLIPLGLIAAPALAAAAAVAVVVGAFTAFSLWVLAEGVKLNTYLTNLFKDLTWDTVWQGIIDGVEDVWNGIAETASTIWDGVVDYFSTLWDALSWVPGWQTIVDGVTGIWDGIATLASNAWDVVVGYFSTLWDSISGLWGTAWTTITGALSTAWSGVKDAASTAWGAVASFFSGLWDGITGIWNTVWSGIKELLSGIWNSIKSSAETIWKSVTDQFDKFIEAANKIPGVQKLLTLTDAWKGAKDLADQLKLTTGQVDDHGKALDKVHPKTGAVTDSHKKHKAALDDLGKALKDVNDKYGEAADNKLKALKAALEKVHQQYLDGKINIVAYHNASKDLNDQIDKLEKTTGNFKFSLENLDNRLTATFNANLKNAKDRMDDFQKSITNTTPTATGLNDALAAQLGVLGTVGTALGDVKGKQDAHTTAIQGVIDKMNPLNTVLGAGKTAMETLSGKAVDLKQKAEDIKTALDTLTSQGITPTNTELAAMSTKVTSLNADYAKLGVDVPADVKLINKELQDLGGDLDLKVKPKISQFQTDITALTKKLGTDLTDALFGDKSFGEVLKNFWGGLKDVIKTTFIDPVTTALVDGFKNIIGSILSGDFSINKLKDIWSDIKGAITGAISEVGKYSDAIKNVPQISTSTGGGSGGSGGGGGSSAGSGLAGTITAFASVGTLISSVIGNFQNARQENTLNAIEESTRYTKIATLEGPYSIVQNTGFTREYLTYVNKSLDTIKDYWSALAPGDLLASIKKIDSNAGYIIAKLDSWDSWVGNISDRAIEQTALLATINSTMAAFASRPNVFNISGNTVLNDGDVGRLADMIYQYLLAKGVLK